MNALDGKKDLNLVNNSLASPQKNHWIISCFENSKSQKKLLFSISKNSFDSCLFRIIFFASQNPIKSFNCFLCFVDETRTMFPYCILLFWAFKWILDACISRKSIFLTSERVYSQSNLDYYLQLICPIWTHIMKF